MKNFFEEKKATKRSSLRSMVMMSGLGLAMALSVLGVSRANAMTAPTATNGTLAITENTSATGMLMASDTNSPALPLTYSIVSNPANGSLSNISASSGAFTYTPNTGFTGNDSFTFMASNGVGSDATATETLAVTASSSSTASTTPPMISGIGVVASDTQATVTWTTDQSGSSQVFYGPNTFYGASSTLDGALVTSHSVTLLGLTPSSTYHFYVATANSSGTVATSSDQTFMTIASPASSTSTSTTQSSTAPTATNGTLAITENTSATGMLMASDTNSPALPLTYSIVSNPANGSLSNISASSGAFTYTPNTGFTGNDSFTFMASNGVWNSAIATEMISVTATSTTSSSTITSTEFATLEAQIQQIEQELVTLLQQVALLKSGTGTTTGGNGGSQTMATIDPQNAAVRAGTSIDFGGRNFTPNERVTVSLNGQTVATAQADGGGNFSTGSLPIPAWNSSNTGSSTTETYTFTGQTSGTTLTDMITVTP